jgi:hypothetical protein
MRNALKKLWHDDGGALIAAEWVFVATILVIGAIVGLVAVRNAVNSELTEMSNAVTSLNQNYSFSGQSGGCGCGDGAKVSGSSAYGDVPSYSKVVSTPSHGQNIDVNPCD